MIDIEQQAAYSNAPRVTSTDWRTAYARRLIATDLAVVAVAVFGSQAFWLWWLNIPILTVNKNHTFALDLTVAALLALTWAIMLASFASREQRFLGSGSTEYRSVVRASLWLFAVVLLVAFTFELPVGRRPLIMAFVVGILGLLLGRWLWRQWLLRQRAQGLMATNVLVVGSASSAFHLATELIRSPSAGYSVIGVCIPEDESQKKFVKAGIPVVGDLDDIQDTMELYNADTVAITSSNHLTPDRVRELSWRLDPGRQHMVLAPSLTDIGGPRISMRPVAGLPLIHVETARYAGTNRLAKRALDVVGSLLLIVASSPFLLAIAIAIRVESPGPILFRQTRVGFHGHTFTMLKFRSMVVDAEARLAQVSELDREEGNGVLFKMRNDPRVTRVGAFIRRFSLDEFPQFFNVLRGDMSLVGPRPPLPAEVELYEDHVHRRFLAKPGITGLWQVNGRSDLSWEDSVRLDLYYVENWSMTGDIVILWKTVRAVLHRQGAY